MREKIEMNERARKRLSNYSFLKFIFENDILDMLVFLVLRHHHESRHKENKLVRHIDIHLSHTHAVEMKAVRENSMNLLRSLREVFKTLIYQLDDYGSAVAPYVE